MATTTNSENLGNENSIQLIINVFILPLVSTIGFLLNLLCVIVYFRLKENELLYKYLFVNSISNSIAMLIDALAPIALCGTHCQISQTYVAQLFYLYGFIYFADVFETFSALIDLIITIDRYFQVENKLKSFRKIRYQIVLIVLFLICLLFYLPFILKKKIIKKTEFVYSRNEYEKSENTSFYSLVPSDFGRTQFGIIFVLIQLIFSELVILCLMISKHLMNLI